ncbi:MAG: 16S rRNA processing protein RimM [Proteobacteria bacterium]|jgi:16S rRNA processing protein RimM|nr:MAG: 16S rRNA processing protein RimM [Pseudomonadota bacterium]
MSAAPARILLGRIRAAHGIRGHVLIRTFTEAPENIAAYGPLEDQTGERQFEVSVVRVTPKGVVARVAGVNDRNAAEALRGTELYVRRDRLPPTEEEEFYHSDLIGLRAFLLDGSLFGEVIAIHNFGAGDILEIRRPDTPRTEMIPFARAFVPEVDIAAGRITVAMASEGEEDESADQG